MHLPWVTSCIFAACGLTSAAVDWDAYESGKLGQYPQAAFRTSKHISVPLIHVDKLHPDCASDDYVFLSPSAPRSRGNQAMIFDHNGDVVWSHSEAGAVKSLQVQSFKGAKYLTYWLGNDNQPGHGHGYYKMLDDTYTLAYAISSLTGLAGDYHEFTISRQNTAIITAYEKVPWNLTSLGREDGYIWDCIFQEIDIESDLLLFQWRASEHFKFNDMSVNSWEDFVGTDEHPWDWFHLNSVEKDAWSNYLIAARYTNAVSYIDGITGAPLWHLGGVQNTFDDLTRGNATAFVDPHMARWADGYTAITLFDNVDFRLKQEEGIVQSHAMKIQIDRKRRKVIDVIDFSHPKGFFAMSGGSMQKLSNGNYFVSYGSAATYSEFSADGTFLCNANYAPAVNASEETGAINSIAQSYRVLKHKWEGHPRHLPSIQISKQKIYVSWNGATQVRSWKVEAQAVANDGAGNLDLVGVFPKTGFETVIELRGEPYELYRLAALDAHGALLRSWYVDPQGGLWETKVERARGRLLTGFHVAALLLVFGSVGLLILLNKRHLPSSRQLRLTPGDGKPAGRRLRRFKDLVWTRSFETLFYYIYDTNA